VQEVLGAGLTIIALAELMTANPYNVRTGSANPQETSMELTRELVEAAFRRNHAATAVALASRWLKHHPEDIWTLFKYAEFLYSMARYDEATHVYEGALATFPDQRWAIFNQLGRMCDYRGQLSEAEQWFRKAVEIEPDEVCAYIFLGSCQARQGKVKDAEATLRAATTWTGHSLLHEAYHNLGLVLRGQGRLNDAAECFQNAIGARPGCSEAVEALSDVNAAIALSNDNLAQRIAHNPNRHQSRPERGGRL
jgi:tetratricopeptide (TPR) repeat protein